MYLWRCGVGLLLPLGVGGCVTVSSGVGSVWCVVAVKCIVWMCVRDLLAEFVLLCAGYVFWCDLFGLVGHELTGTIDLQGCPLLIDVLLHFERGLLLGLRDHWPMF